MIVLPNFPCSGKKSDMSEEKNTQNIENPISGLGKNTLNNWLQKYFGWVLDKETR